MKKNLKYFALVFLCSFSESFCTNSLVVQGKGVKKSRKNSFAAPVNGHVLFGENQRDDSQREFFPRSLSNLEEDQGDDTLESNRSESSKLSDYSDVDSRAFGLDVQSYGMSSRDSSMNSLPTQRPLEVQEALDNVNKEPLDKLKNANKEAQKHLDEIKRQEDLLTAYKRALRNQQRPMIVSQEYINQLADFISQPRLDRNGFSVTPRPESAVILKDLKDDESQRLKRLQ